MADYLTKAMRRLSAKMNSSALPMPNANPLTPPESGSKRHQPSEADGNEGRQSKRRRLGEGATAVQQAGAGAGTEAPARVDRA